MMMIFFFFFFSSEGGHMHAPQGEYMVTWMVSQSNNNQRTGVDEVRKMPSLVGLEKLDSDVLL